MPNTNHLKLARLAAGLTQAKLSKKSGVGQVAISLIETGDTKQPSYETAVLLARALNLTPEDLFPVQALEARQ